MGKIRTEIQQMSENNNHQQHNNENSSPYSNRNIIANKTIGKNIRKNELKLVNNKNKLRNRKTQKNILINENLEEEFDQQNQDNINKKQTTNKMTNKSNLVLKFIFTVTIFLLIFISMPTLTNATDLHEENLVEYEDIKLNTLNQSVKYISSTKYYLRGMGPFYLATNMVLDWFIGKEAIPDGYIVVAEKEIKLGPKVENNDWGELLKHYWGILLVVVIIALLVVLMPIIGLCFCCCRCAGSCGGRSQPFDKKHDTCRRVFLGLLLICVTTGMLFGVVICFATNQYIQEGVDSSMETIRNGSEDVQTYLNATSAEIKHLLVDNYEAVSRNLKDVLKNTSTVIMAELEEKSKAISLKHLAEFMESFPEIKSNLHRIKIITNELRVNASQLSDGLRGVKRELLQTLNKCGVQDCKDVMKNYTIGKLDANGIDYNQLPDVTSIISSVGELETDDVGEAVKRGNEAINEMKTKLNEAINKNIPKVETAINKAGDAIKNTNNQIHNLIMNSMSKELRNNTNYYTNQGDRYLEEYSMYRFYVGVAISSVLLLVLCALTVALLCGICGKRPDGYGDDCCNKGSGARFLMLAVTVIFLTISVLAAAALIHFLVGLLLHRGVCEPLKNPENDQVFQYIDNFIDLNKLFEDNIKKVNKKFKNTGSLPPFRITNIITDCQQNKTFYEILRMSNYVAIEDIKDYPKDYGIYQNLEDLKEKVKIDTSNFKMLDDDDKAKINKLQNSLLKDFDSVKFLDNLGENITVYNLSEIAIKLRETAQNIKDNKNMRDVAVSLRNQALHLETYQINLVQPMIEHSDELRSLAKNLEDNLRLKERPFEQSIELIKNEIEEAEKYIREQGDNLVKNEATLLTDHFIKQIQNYIDFVIEAIEKKIGKCGPIANVYASGVVLACNKVIDPLNAFWAGLAWCVLLFLPTLVLSIKLSSLYQKSDPYPGPLVESVEADRAKYS